MSEEENNLNQDLKYSYQCNNCGSYQKIWIRKCVNCKYDNTGYLLSLPFKRILQLFK